MTDDAGTYSDAIGSLIDQTKRLAKAEAEVTRLRAVVARVEAALDIRTQARAWMTHLGYDDPEIDKAEAWRQPREPWLQDDPPQSVIDLSMAADCARQYEEVIRAALAAPQPTTPDLADTRARADAEEAR